MPANVVESEKDEEKWEKAKERAKEQGEGENYEYIMGIYKNMDPEGIDEPENEKKGSMIGQGLRKIANL